jgi:Uma2 family endonuclease
VSDPAPRRWTVAEFFAWQEGQPNRYEFVDGFPVRLMAGAKNVHDDTVVNLVAELRNQLRGSGCRTFTGDGSFATGPGRIRRPDAGVDCGRRDPGEYKAAEPRLVAEVLSPTTRDADAFEKLAEYKQVENLTHVLLVEPNAPEVVLWARDADRTWQKRSVDGLGQEMDLPEIGITLALADLYDGVAFPARPRLALNDGGEGDSPPAPEAERP